MNTKTTASKSATVAATAAVSATAPVTTPAAKAPKAPKAEKKATATTAAVKAPKAPKAEKPVVVKVEVPSKKSKALPIITADIAAGVARKDTIAKLLDASIGCSAAGANTYYQNVKSGAWK